MLTSPRSFGLGLALAVALGGCAREPQSTQAPAAADTRPAQAAAADVDAGYGPENLMDPDSPKLNETAPDVFRARFTTTAGTLVIEVTRAWSPNGADRFYNLVRNGFFDDTYFFRAIPGFMAQFGLPADPRVATAWSNATIADDPAAGHSNAPGMVSFAKTGAPNSRSTQLFVNFGNNANLDPMGFTPIGKVIDGMDAVNAIYTGYGESRPGGMGPTQPEIKQRGSTFLAENYPKLTRIESAVVVRD